MDDPSSGTSDGTGSPTGVDAENVSVWFAENIPGVVPPLTFVRIPGGRSNLTFEVTDRAGHKYVLRRPPTGHLLPTAHDMSREHRIIAALGPAGVPAPPALGLCMDNSVNGAPFYVMDFVEGIIARTEKESEADLDLAGRHRAGMALVDTLSRIHGVDPDAVGLGDLGRKEGYISRQLRRWEANYRAANEARGGTPLTDVEEAHAILAGTIPKQGPATVVHGDYRLDNCILSPDGDVRAVLDWELCTLGDPMADIGQLLVYWSEPGEKSPLGHSATTVPGFPVRAELSQRYGQRTGRDMTHLDFYVAFAYWKLACILEGVYARYVAGAMGNDSFDFTFYPRSIGWLASRARETAARMAQ